MTDTSSTDAAERPLMLSDATEQFRYVVLALQRQGGRQLNRLFSTLGLTASQAEAIEVIGTFGPMTTRRAGEYLVCESGSPSRLSAPARVADPYPSAVPVGPDRPARVERV